MYRMVKKNFLGSGKGLKKRKANELKIARNFQMVEFPKIMADSFKNYLQTQNYKKKWKRKPTLVA
jgi:hypothetical protein